MKIYRPLINIFNILDTTQKQGKIKSDITDPNLSSNNTKPPSDLIGAVREKLAKMPEVDTEQIEKIKTALNQKTFQVDIPELAKTIINFHKKS